MRILLPLTLFSIYCVSTFAAKKACSDLKDCVNKVSQLTRKDYITTVKLKGDVFFSKDFKLTADNADAFLSLILYNNGYTRIALDEQKYDLIATKDVRYRDIPILKAEQAQIPDTHDFIMLEYKLQNPIHLNGVERGLRAFISRYGRIMSIKNQGTIIIQDTAKNAKRLLKLIRSIDLKPDAKLLEKLDKEQAHKREISRLKAQSCSSFKNDMQDFLKKLKSKI